MQPAPLKSFKIIKPVTTRNIPDAARWEIFSYNLRSGMETIQPQRFFECRTIIHSWWASNCHERTCWTFYYGTVKQTLNTDNKNKPLRTLHSAPTPHVHSSKWDSHLVMTPTSLNQCQLVFYFWKEINIFKVQSTCSSLIISSDAKIPTSISMD